ncbi:sce7726 family protein [Vibrio splendidus]
MSTNDSPLELEIKSILINHLIDGWLVGSQDLIINEFTVGDFSRRVDLALIKSERMFAFEIKSSADTLTRLQGQVDKYLTYFDKVIVVTAPKHTNKVIEQTPSYVAVWEVTANNISIKRKGRVKLVSSKKELIEMMTAIELKKLARELKINTPDTKRKSLEAVLSSVPAYKLRKAAIEFVRLRYQSRSDRFFGRLNEGLSTPEDLDSLRQPNKRSSAAVNPSIESFISALEELHQSSEGCFTPKSLIANV